MYDGPRTWSALHGSWLADGHNTGRDRVSDHGDSGLGHGCDRYAVGEGDVCVPRDVWTWWDGQLLRKLHRAW